MKVLLLNLRLLDKIDQGTAANLLKLALIRFHDALPDSMVEETRRIVQEAVEILPVGFSAPLQDKGGLAARLEHGLQAARLCQYHGPGLGPQRQACRPQRGTKITIERRATSRLGEMKTADAMLWPRPFGHSAETGSRRDLIGNCANDPPPRNPATNHAQTGSLPSGRIAVLNARRRLVRPGHLVRRERRKGIGHHDDGRALALVAGKHLLR